MHTLTLHLKQNGGVKAREFFEKPASDPKIESILPLDPDPKIEWICANIEWM